MPLSWESSLERWAEAGLLDPETAAWIRAWEAGQGSRGLRWPARVALSLGGILLAAGVLLFVAAHWEALSPGRRFTLVLATVAGFHLGGAVVAARFSALALTLHACGTVALGGGIFLAGQIFHLQEHWPGGLMLWSAGAWLGWALRRDWAQGALAALITPAWLAGEWLLAADDRYGASTLAVGLLGLALAYLGAEPSPGARLPVLRRALVWIGGLALIPATILLVVAVDERHRLDALPAWVSAGGWLGAVGIPLAVAWLLRGPDGWPVGAGIGWAVLAVLLGDWTGVMPYLWLGALALGLIGWGVLDRRPERINLGVAGFALTVGAFYFSSVMDKLGRSASLVSLGLLFLGGGYLLERARRRLLAGMRAPA